ncbi:enoyl-CoA hydratase family protein [Fodinicola acaciae]|uniref:enoyl-CoA hydratase family protein n=1 Tax=Fodinicola acaciae TaxID=2681555 RepID=UPI0013D5CAA6|nr:enoyl-CoA hydratase family protein [Fodinicola acaciae]
MTDELVHYEVDRAVATITLDSPHNRNALSAQLVSELENHLATAAEDDGIRAIVLTHTGGTFCAGADLTTAGKAVGGGGAAASMLALLRSIAALPKPVIARIDGHVRAGGLGVIGSCDIVVAGPASSFAFTEVRLGLAPAVISLVTQSRMTERAASRYYLTGEKFDAAEAERIGLVTVAVADVRSETEKILAELRTCSPQGLAESKVVASRALVSTMDADGVRVQEQSARLFASEEAAEGMRAFLERRPPRWAVE